MDALKTIARCLFGVGLVVAAAWAIARMAPPPAAERAAIAALTAPWSPPGSNAFDDLWLLDYEVPPARRAALVEADDAAPVTIEPERDDAAARAGMRPLRPTDADRRLLCGRDDDCVARVDADRSAFRALVDRNAALLHNVAELRRHGHVRNRVTRIAMPRYQYASAPATAHALRFVEGDRAGALALACVDLATWRRLAAHNDTLIGAMVAVATAERYGALLAAMTARMRDGTWPAGCDAALAPPDVAAGMLGRALAGEIDYQRRVERELLAQAPFLTRVLYDGAQTRARVAIDMQRYSGPAIREAVAADRRIEQAPPTRLGWRDWRCIANFSGCILVSGDLAPGYADYARRMQDHCARLQLLSALAWLHKQPPSDEPLQSSLARWPGQWPAPARQVEAVEGDALRIRLFDTRRGDYWNVPAPGSLVDDDAPSAPPPADRLRRT